MLRCILYHFVVCDFVNVFFGVSSGRRVKLANNCSRGRGKKQRIMTAKQRVFLCLRSASLQQVFRSDMGLKRGVGDTRLWARDSWGWQFASGFKCCGHANWAVAAAIAACKLDDRNVCFNCAMINWVPEGGWGEVWPPCKTTPLSSTLGLEVPSLEGWPRGINVTTM